MLDSFLLPFARSSSSQSGVWGGGGGDHQCSSLQPSGRNKRCSNSHLGSDSETFPSDRFITPKRATRSSSGVLRIPPSVSPGVEGMEEEVEEEEEGERGCRGAKVGDGIEG